jgi:ribose 5-phosphate isomerase A
MVLQRDDLKRAAALKSLDYVGDGMVVGLGTGTTANYMIEALAERVRQGLRIQGVPTSKPTADLARSLGIPLVDREDQWAIDVMIDGADQVDRQFNLIKGGGGALLKEKIVAQAARRVIIIVDYLKCVPVLGDPVPLPVEIVPFGWGSTARQIEALGFTTVLRHKGGAIFTTESGHYILDVQVKRIDQPRELATRLNAIAGVVESGLFVGCTDTLIVGTPGGVEVTHAKSQQG